MEETTCKHPKNLGVASQAVEALVKKKERSSPGFKIGSFFAESM
ncbi:MAG: hypothetical protein ACP5KW_00580 [Thermoproteota archaeon]|jgi:hypothetical protein